MDTPIALSSSGVRGSPSYLLVATIVVSLWSTCITHPWVQTHVLGVTLTPFCTVCLTTPCQEVKEGVHGAGQQHEEGQRAEAPAVPAAQSLVAPEEKGSLSTNMELTRKSSFKQKGLPAPRNLRFNVSGQGCNLALSEDRCTEEGKRVPLNWGNPSKWSCHVQPSTYSWPNHARAEGRKKAI